MRDSPAPLGPMPTGVCGGDMPGAYREYILSAYCISPLKSLMGYNTHFTDEQLDLKEITVPDF